MSSGSDRFNNQGQHGKEWRTRWSGLRACQIEPESGHGGHSITSGFDREVLRHAAAAHPCTNDRVRLASVETAQRAVPLTGLAFVHDPEVISPYLGALVADSCSHPWPSRRWVVDRPGRGHGRSTTVRDLQGRHSTATQLGNPAGARFPRGSFTACRSPCNVGSHLVTKHTCGTVQNWDSTRNAPIGWSVTSEEGRALDEHRPQQPHRAQTLVLLHPPAPAREEGPLPR